ncbi:uncharacterized protein LOC119291618 isoform X2 [Triticum dicoccoides]|uniref:uncharacterized protein LOC119291618 isoform X2 n=1 Tax=Triticum dicoccoides TaxID=85692 RepID=UPI000E7C6351|nr:uncharacterized protein LOC119291618 isoform X2 [Triticum dicoccoides]XP_044371253.1 uncharacterized protein LOC123093360 isoform X2 [Triticum aestivum]
MAIHVAVVVVLRATGWNRRHCTPLSSLCHCRRRGQAEASVRRRRTSRISAPPLKPPDGALHCLKDYYCLAQLLKKRSWDLGGMTHLDTKPISIGGSPNHSQSPVAHSRIRDDETQETEAGKSLNEKLTCANGPNDSFPQHGELPLPEVSTSVGDADMQDSVKSLSEKLSAALLTISAKEDLVKQHAKVAEDVVAGWELAEGEVSNLKRPLDASSLKNPSLGSLWLPRRRRPSSPPHPGLSPPCPPKGCCCSRRCTTGGAHRLWRSALLPARIFFVAE